MYVCEDCKIKLVKPESNMSTNDIFINEKNFKKDTSNFGSLNAPSDEWFEISKLLVQVFEICFNQNGHMSNICEEMVKICILKIKSDYPLFLPPEEDECYNQPHS